MIGVLAAFMALCSCYCFAFSYQRRYYSSRCILDSVQNMGWNWQRRDARSFMKMDATDSSVLAPDSAEDLFKDDLRKWYTLNYQRRVEVEVSKALLLTDINTELWESILRSLRVLEEDQTSMNYDSLHAFPQIILTATNADKVLDDLKSLSNGIIEDQMSQLFQPNFNRSIDVLVRPATASGNDATVVIVVNTRRLKPNFADFSDIENAPTTDEALWTNDIAGFPFATVWEFVDEIKRPSPEIVLTFDYKIKDLKYDLTKMKKKSPPADVVKNINMKLSKLKMWRDILSREPDENDIPDLFVDSAGWSEAVKFKYQSLKTLAQTNPTKALETQYDKRAVYIKFIDQWTDKIKRSFKFTYFASKRPPEDFKKAIMDSAWRNEVLNTTRLLGEAPFLDFAGPNFTPGAPKPLFMDDRYVMYSPSYEVGLIMYEMLAWLRKMEAVQSVASISTGNVIVQHTYSRGELTERTMFDVWLGISHWLQSANVDDTIKSKASISSKPLPSAAALTDSLSLHRPRFLQTEIDHTDDFMATLRGINKVAREKSVSESSSVKDLFKGYYTEGKKLTEWWTQMIRDLDLLPEMESKVLNRTSSWSAIMEHVCLNSTSTTTLSDGLEARTAAKLWEENAELWSTRYKGVMNLSETIEGLLPFRNERDETYSSAGLDNLAKHTNFPVDRAVTIDLSHNNQGGSSFLFVCPRYFRGIALESGRQRGGFNMDMELSAFQQFAKLVDQSLRRSGARFIPPGKAVTVIALHPKASTIQFRAPHPGLIFTLKDA